MDVFNLYAKLSLNTDDYEKGVEKAKGGASSLMDVFSGTLLGNVVSDGLRTVANGITEIGKTAANMAVSIGKASLDSYADYEQLVGGVETLYKDSAGIIESYAKDAYKNVGLSANDYMETSTSFAAALVSSLGGDTGKAAEMANTAISDMSDNANKMGTNMQSIQDAYNGFAKQNYTMLDNLKIGYGGTQAEMKRLIKEAAAMTDTQKELGVTVDSNSMSYANIVQAIHVVQGPQGEVGPEGPAGKDGVQIDDAAVSEDAPWSSKHIIDMLCPPIEESGNPVVCYPVVGYPLGVKASWEPVQEGSGTPSPENIRPIKGLGSVTVTRCGENLLNFPQTTTWTQITKTLEFKFKAGTYYLCCGNVVHGGSSAPAIAFFNAASSNVATISIEQGMKKEIKLKDCQFVILYTNGYDYYGSAGVTATVEDLMLVASNEIPSVYTPYTGQTNTLTLPETVYGGEVDAVNGEGKKTWEMLTLDGTENWLVFDAGGTGQFFYTTKYIFDKTPIEKICSHFSNVSFTGTAIVRIYTNMFTDVDALESYLAAQYAAGTPVQICYKLAEPVPFTATGAQAIPALAGVNTVLTDADSATVTGRADPIKRITDLEDAVASQT